MGPPHPDGKDGETRSDAPAVTSPPSSSGDTPTSAEGALPITVKLVRERRRRRTPREEPRAKDEPRAKEAPRAEETRRTDEMPETVSYAAGLPLAATIDAAPHSMPIGDPKGWERYEILKLLGRGGMGAVYEAKDRRLGRHVAIKFIQSTNPLTTLRFLREARAQSRIDHPNVCKVLEVGEVEGKAYIAMQLIRGLSLSHAARTMTLDEKVRLMKTVAEAVNAAHRMGIIHRDIKPANIMVEEVESADQPTTKRPVLMDFGLARESSETKGLTESGAVMGTPAYMPPEQARGNVRIVDARSDIYSLGATLYDLLAGVPPFEDDSAVNILLKVIAQDPVPLRVRDPSIPPALEVIVGKCLNKEPHQRYASAADLADDLDRFLNKERVFARRLSLPTRLYWRARRNKPMAFAIIGLIVSLLAFAGYGVRTVIVNARNEAIARQRAELGQKLGQAVKELEWLVRSAYLVPLHDTSPEKAGVRERMAQIEADMRSFGDLGAGLDHYALGRGHFALGEWDAAHTQLTKAETLGVAEPELHYALGRVLGELYSRALDDARRSGDKGYFQQRKQELEKEYLGPALSHLERCRGLKTIPASYLEGLIHFYHARYDEALQGARSAQATSSWLYEAHELEGHVFMARALDKKDKGDNDQAEKDFMEAVAHYERAADIGRSDHRLYEALAEAWIRQEEMDMYRGRDAAPKLEKALAAADKALIAAPAESHGHTKKAFAYYFQAQYAHHHGAQREEVERLYKAQIASGEQAIAKYPADAYAHEIAGLAYTQLAIYLLDLGQPVEPLLDSALARLREAIRLNPGFPWAHNDYAVALGYSGYSRKLRNENPEDWFEKATVAAKKAIELDDQYMIAYNNSAIWLTELAEWKADHGADPEKAVMEAVQLADRAIQINKQNSFPHVNAGLAVTKLASYRLDAGQDGRETARLAVDRFKAALVIDPSFVFAQRELGRAYHLLGSLERPHALDPRPSLDAGIAALGECYRIEPGNAECKAVEAQLLAERAEWAREQREPFADLLEKAQKLAAEAVQKLPDRADLALVLGQICLRRAEVSTSGPQPSAPPQGVVEEGLRAVEQSLKRAPGLPRALAVQGALLAQQAKAESEPARKKATLEKARESLSKAFAANPLLARRYGGVAAEAKRLAESQ